MERKLFVGDVVVLNRPCLGNDAWTKGVVYEEYDLGAGPGASIIFRNGNYDGFSVQEQSSMLEKVGHSSSIESYKFKNVIQLNRDFESGLFNKIFTYVK